MLDALLKAVTCRISCASYSGTGHLVATDKVLTARHCVLPAIEDGSEIFLDFRGRENAPVNAKVIAECKELDACLLQLNESVHSGNLCFDLNAYPPEEGRSWQTFGYPKSKKTLGHRVAGDIAQVLETPVAKIDIDLSIEPKTLLPDYGGMSGAAIVSGGAIVGIVREKYPGTIAGLSIHSLRKFLTENGVIQEETETEPNDSLQSSLADRSQFQYEFEKHIIERSPGFVFIEGSHGIGKTTFCEAFHPETKSLLCIGSYSILQKEGVINPQYRSQPEVLHDWLSNAVSETVTGQPSRREKMLYPDLVRSTTEILHALSRFCISSGKWAILFVDGLNEVPSSHPDQVATLIGLFPLKLPPNITLVLTAPNYAVVAPHLGGRVDAGDKKSIPPLGDEAVLSYCSRTLSESVALPQRIAAICEKAQGNPLYLRYLIEFANGHAPDAPLDEFPILSGPIESYYAKIWSRLATVDATVDVLAVLARMRAGIDLRSAIRLLSSHQVTFFLNTIESIRHLLASSRSTAFFHSSFVEFIQQQTSSVDQLVHARIGNFCVQNPDISYCRTNAPYHFLQAGAEGCKRAVELCNQEWLGHSVDAGVAPDLLIFDIQSVVAAAVAHAAIDQIVRVLLLSQRANFQYNTLLTQSADLLAGALIALGRSQEAMQFVFRYKTLILSPQETHKVALQLLKAGYTADAIRLLKALHLRILEGYQTERLEVEAFLHLTRYHIRTLFFIRLAGGGRNMEQVLGILGRTSQILHHAVGKSDPAFVYESMLRLSSLSTSYFLCFRDSYPRVEHMRSEMEGTGVEKQYDIDSHLRGILNALLELESDIERFDLKKQRASLPHVFADIHLLMKEGAKIPESTLLVVVDTLIGLGAPQELVIHLCSSVEPPEPQPVTIRQENGVDVDFRKLTEEAFAWRLQGYLGHAEARPVITFTNPLTWINVFERVIENMLVLDGRARRQLNEPNVEKMELILQRLMKDVVAPLEFTFAERIRWQDSYGIPESLLPYIYRNLFATLRDCFPDGVSIVLQKLTKASSQQCGLYTEGFRVLAYQAVKASLLADLSEVQSGEVLDLLSAYRDHVLDCVENRHELVPELLQMIPLFVELGATEQGENLYRRMLAVAMGPSWYKEEQLGLMTNVIAKMPSSADVSRYFPSVAGYLQRASGEMTFQRYVRFDKSSLIGVLCEHGLTEGACRYFMRQSCGTHDELLADLSEGKVDRVSPTVGMRYAGGALEEQHAIIQIVRKATSAAWPVRWAMLEVFLCGDKRHLSDYAELFGQLSNEAARLEDGAALIVDRINRLIFCELDGESRVEFVNAFFRSLAPHHRATFPDAMGVVGVSDQSFVKPAAVREESRKQRSTNVDDDFLYCPGTFGRQSAMREGDAILENAERQLKLGNRHQALKEAVRVLSTLQDGGWCVWQHLSSEASRSEEIILAAAKSATDVVRPYVDLLGAERYVPRWIQVQHLVEKAKPLITSEEQAAIVECVLEHFALMVGSSSDEIDMFSFLSKRASADDESTILLRFLGELARHPQWLRRDRVACLLWWLIMYFPDLFRKVGAEALHDSGYFGDIVWGVLDSMSLEKACDAWCLVNGWIDVSDFVFTARHVSRMGVLRRIARRASGSGVASANGIVEAIGKRFRVGAVKLEASFTAGELPTWARSIKREWTILNELGYGSQEMFDSLSAAVGERVAPLSVVDAWGLEKSVCETFGEPFGRSLGRWEGLVRQCLNAALLPYVAEHDLAAVEECLRVYNPGVPEEHLDHRFRSLGRSILQAVEQGTLASSVIWNDMFLLNYFEIMFDEEDGRMSQIEIVAVMAPTALRRRSYWTPNLECSFASTEEKSKVRYNAVEVCAHLVPKFAFFGSFTPGMPYPEFERLAGAPEAAFRRFSWRGGREWDKAPVGRPLQEGCLLAVKTGAVKLPESKKLAWIFKVDEEIVGMVDAANNLLY